eukprot:8506499-Pyramimonas_sp.AAC.1
MRPPPDGNGNALPVDQFRAVCFRPKTDNCVGCGSSACNGHIDASARRCSRCDLWKSERSADNMREEEIASNAANREIGTLRLKAIIADPN